MSRGEDAEIEAKAHKVVLVGDSACGKTSLIIRINKGTFLSNPAPSIWSTFVTKSISIDDGTSICLNMWDTAGEERYASLVPHYSRGAEALVIVYDCSRRSTFEGAKAWVNRLREYHSNAILWFLVANKVDLPSVVQADEIEQYTVAEKLRFFETSAKTGQGVEALLSAIASNCPTVTCDRVVQLDAKEASPPSGVCC